MHIDDPTILRRLFYPQKTPSRRQLRSGVVAILFEIAPYVQISGRFCLHSPESPNIIFFHGNGEVAADYEDIGPKFSKMGANFLVLDYRGYGESGGQPSNSSMIEDARALFPKVVEYLSENGNVGPVVIMGRSLGSASAIEIALNYTPDLAGLVLESAFARPEPLLELLGVPREIVDQIDCTAIANVEKIAHIYLPLLVMHGEEDSLIPESHGKALYEASPAEQKELCIIPEAEHNTILLFDHYFVALKGFLESLSQ